MKETISWYASPIGAIKIISNADFILGLYFSEDKHENSPAKNNSLLFRLHEQLDQYFSGRQMEFNLPLSPKGTYFQQSVWKLLLDVKYGQTLSYMDLAKKMGDVKKIRAVANANAKNPISILITCHRIIGSDGKLTGYAGGLHRKKYLLELEQKTKQLGLF